jgi:hypothetical protein
VKGEEVLENNEDNETLERHLTDIESIDNFNYLTRGVRNN